MNKPTSPNPELPPSHQLRPPLELRQYEPGACATVCMANALHMLGFDYPFSDPHYIDHQVGREPSQPQHLGELLLYALEQGVSVRGVDSFDNKRFLLEGRSYLENAYPELVGPEFYEYWTDNQVAIRQSALQTETARLMSFESYTTETRQPDILTDIVKPLADGHIVLFQTNVSSNVMVSHTVIAYGISPVDGLIDVYRPRQATDTELLIGVDEAWIDEEWAPEDGLFILSK